MIPMSIYARRPEHKSRYQTGDIIKTNSKAYGTLTRYGQQTPFELPKGLQGSVAEVAPFRQEGHPPSWIYRIKFPPSTGEDRYWIRGGMLVLVERNPALKRPVQQRRTIKSPKKAGTVSRAKIRKTIRSVMQRGAS